MRRALLLVLTLILLLSLTACFSGLDTDTLDDLQDAVDNLEATDASVEETETGSAGSTDIGWPSDIPSDVPQLTGVTITACVQETTRNAYTVFFECSEKDVILDYVDQLTAAGIVQDSLSGNDFGLDYYGSSDAYDIFINYVSGGLSKLNVNIK